MHGQPTTGGTLEQRPFLPDSDEDQARANAMVAFMAAGALEMMVRLVAFDDRLRKAVTEAWSLALQSMARERQQFMRLRARRLKDARRRSTA
jgi:hypothetical protein